MATTRQSKTSTGSRSSTKKPSSNGKKTSTTPKKSTTNSRSRTTKGNKQNNKQNRQQQSTYEFPLKREITILGVLAFCILLFVSSFSLFGNKLIWLKHINLGIFGVIGYVIPFLLFGSVCFLIANSGDFRAKIKVFGILLMTVSSCVIANILFQTYTEKLTIIGYYKLCKNGFAGGALGGIFISLLYPFLGMIGCTIIFSLIFLIGGVIVTEKSVVSVVQSTSTKAYSNFQQDMEVRKTNRAVRMEERQIQREKERFERLEEKRRQLAQLQEEKEEQRKRFETPIRGIGDTTIKKETVLNKSEKQTSDKKDTIISVDNGLSNQTVNVDTFTGEIFYSDNYKDNTSRDNAYKEAIECTTPSLENITIDGLHTNDKEDMVSVQMSNRDMQNEENYEHLQYYQDNYDSYDDLSGENDYNLYHDESSSYDDTYNDFNEEYNSYNSSNNDYDEYNDSIHDSLQEQIVEQNYTEEDSEYKTVITSTGKVMRVELDGIPGAKKGPKPAQREKEYDSFDASNGDYSQKFPSEDTKAPEIIPYEEPKEYVFPPMDLLQPGQAQTSQKSMEAELRQTAIKLQQTLQNFGVGVTVTNISCGPSVTRYELQPEQGVKVSKIVSLTDDIKLNLAAADIRMEAPIPGKAAIGIEVPNKENSTVMLRDLLESKEFKEHSSKVAFATGKDIGGQTIVADIAKMPHLLIAGATGSGKSVCINTLIISILYKAKPSEVKLIMIDPKVVELSVYNGIPHLLIPVVTDPKKAAGALNWAVTEMTERYKKFAELNVRDMKGYNEKISTIEHLEGDKPEKMPQIVIIVDELADLMMVAPGDVEDAICRLAQMARAAGIHLVIATQRPSVNVITGLIKANVPSRIAFSVSSGVDSRTIIDMNGAEKLLGKGDMLFYPSGYQKPVRVQGAFVSDKEVASVVEFLAEQKNVIGATSNSSENLTAAINSSGSVGSNVDRDEYFRKAAELIIDKDKASIGMLQRALKVGFNRAARIMDQLADAGIVGEEEGTKPRKVLMSMEEFQTYIEEQL